MDGPRLNSRLSLGQAISTYSAVLRNGGHDPLDALILSAVAHLGADPAGVDPPLAARRPVSRDDVARSLGLSDEAARRRTQKLIDAGALRDAEGSLMVAGPTRDHERVLAMAGQNAALLRRTVRLMRDARAEF